MLELEAGRPDTTLQLSTRQPVCASFPPLAMVARISHLVSLIQLSQRNEVIKPSQTYIPTINDLRPLIQGALAGIDGDAIREHPLATRPDAARAEACARSPGGCRVERCAENGDVVPVSLGLLI